MPETENKSPPVPALAARGAIGGVLMGLANLVPGISGGTMLLAAGVYRPFIDAIAEITTFRFRFRSIVVLGSIVVMAALGIVLLAGPIKELVVHHRWVMYSLFIGLTLGGVPLVWRMARPASPSVGVGFVVGLLAMVAMFLIQPGSEGSDQRNYAMLALAGLAGAAAMVLPGVSGGYLLLVLGQYVPILSSISRCKDAVSARDIDALLAEMHVVIPVGIGVVVGVVGISNLVRWLLNRFEKPTLGVLLGLLFGAVIGLWPFQAGVAPAPGDVIKGTVMTESTMAELDPEDYPTQAFSPRAAQVGGALGLIVVGFGATVAIARLTGGRRDDEHD